MPLDRSEVEHLAALVRVGLSDAELEMLRHQLSDILAQFEVLQQLDTSGVVATGHAGDLESVMRDDVAGECLTNEEVLANAPRTEGPLIRVKAVLEE